MHAKEQALPEHLGVLKTVTVVDLPERVDVRASLALKQELALAVMNGTAVTFDASKVTRISTAGCQLILSFVNLMQTLNRKVDFKQPSNTFSKAVELLGIKGVLTKEI